MLLFHWKSFKGLERTFNQSVNFTFLFNERNFNIYFAAYESSQGGTTHSILQSNYKAIFDPARIHEINHQLANRVYDFIAAKVAEADSAPS